MKKNIFAIIALVLCMSVMLCACGGGTNDGTSAPTDTQTTPPADTDNGGQAPGDTSAETVKLTFGTGGDSGTYYAYGNILSQYVSNATNLSITAVTSGGSQANIEDLDGGDIQLGFAQSDVMSYAYTGTNLFDTAIDSFSVAAALYMEQVQIVTLDPNIKTVADLAGKTVSIGSAGSGTYYNAIDILGVYGLSEDDIIPVYQSFGDSAESLQDGKIDAAFVVAGAPTVAISSLSASNDVYLVSLDNEHIDSLIGISPYYSAYTITADTYGTDGDIQTVAVGAVVIVSDDMSEDAVYAFVSTIFENIGAISELHGKGLELDLEFASSITDVPYHPGAAKYFAEKGFDVPTK